MPIDSGVTPLAEADLPFLDVMGPQFGEDPWATVAQLRTSPAGQQRLLRSDRGVELIGYEDIGEALADRRLRTLRSDYWEEHGAGPMTLAFLDQGNLLYLPAEQHLRVRRHMVGAFPASRIERSREEFHEIANRLVDSFLSDGRCDLVWDFTHRYSIEILCRLIGVPAEDVPRFEQATLDLVLLNMRPFESVADRVEASLSTLWDYCVDLVARRRAQPLEDFVSSMLPAYSERTLSEDELIWGLANLLFAGHDTTRYQLASICRALIEAGDWDEVGRHPEWAPQVVEEGMRAFPVVLVLTRVVDAEDFVWDGVHLPPGTIVRLNLLAANRDPARFEHPDRFDLRRERRHTIPFGHGLHKCIGHALARADLEIGVEVLTARLRNARLDGEGTFRAVTGALWGPTSLPVAFDVPAADSV
jgi:cytochrome P450